MNKKLRIIQVGIKYPPAHGGVEVTLRQECEWLKRRGHAVQVLTSDLEQHLSGIKLSNAPRLVNGISITRCWSFYLPKIRRYPILPSLPLRLALSRADIVHAHGYWFFPADAAGAIRRLKKKPFVFNPHFCPRSSRLWDGYTAQVGRRTMEAADVVIVVSRWEEELLRASGFKPRRVETVSSGVDPTEFEKVNHNVFIRYGLEGAKVILFVGRIAPDKGISVLLEAAPLILDHESCARLVIVGHDFGYLEGYREKARLLGLDTQVIFTGPLPREDVISAFKYADVFVLPSQYEAFGLVLAEAMYGKTPVVASRTSAVPYVVRDGIDGFLFPFGDHEALAAHAIRLLKDDDLLHTMGQAGHQSVLDHYNVNEHYLRLEAIYRSIV